LAEQAIAQASIERADLICFPECFIPGYRGLGKSVPPPDPAFLERAWSALAAAAAKAKLAVIVGTERIADGAFRATALVINQDGTKFCVGDPPLSGFFRTEPPLLLLGQKLIARGCEAVSHARVGTLVL
jgi:Carbon-nitrogen hydrolase